MYILQSLPVSDITKKVCLHFSSNNGLISQPGKTHAGDPVLAEWVHFTDNIAPLSDDVEKYCATNSLHIPFRDILFGSATDLPFFNQPPAKKTRVLETQARCLASVNWTNRNVKRPKNDPARTSARETITEEDTESSHSTDSSSDESADEYDYRPLAYKQKHKGNPFLKYIGCTFTDADEESGIVEGTVTEIVMESVNNNVCFQYVEENNDEPQYIVAKFAVDNCIWKSDIISNTSIVTKRKTSNAKGWTLLAASEQTPVALLDQAIEVSGKRFRKQVEKTKK